MMSVHTYIATYELVEEELSVVVNVDEIVELWRIVFSSPDYKYVESDSCTRDDIISVTDNLVVLRNNQLLNYVRYGEIVLMKEGGVWKIHGLKLVF